MRRRTPSRSSLPPFTRDREAGEARDSESMEPGGGGRFAALKGKLGKRKGVRDPAALAASIGRKKYGKKKMAGFSAKGRKRKGPSKMMMGSAFARTVMAGGK